MVETSTIGVRDLSSYVASGDGEGRLTVLIYSQTRNIIFLSISLTRKLRGGVRLFSNKIFTWLALQQEIYLTVSFSLIRDPLDSGILSNKKSTL